MLAVVRVVKPGFVSESCVGTELAIRIFGIVQIAIVIGIGRGIEHRDRTRRATVGVDVIATEDRGGDRRSCRRSGGRIDTDHERPEL